MDILKVNSVFIGEFIFKKRAQKFVEIKHFVTSTLLIKDTL